MSEIFFCAGRRCDDTLCERDHVSSFDIQPKTDIFTVHSEVGILVSTIVTERHWTYETAEMSAMRSAHPSWVTDSDGNTIYVSM